MNFLKKSSLHILGRTKLEPIAVVILSVIMSLASIQLIVESAEKIAGLAQGKEDRPDVGVTTIVLLSSTIGKVSMWYVKTITFPSHTVY